jgi:hypothetical protein
VVARSSARPTPASRALPTAAAIALVMPTGPIARSASITMAAALSIRIAMAGFALTTPVSIIST